MVESNIIFQCQDELQMKAVALLVQKASAYSGSISLEVGGRHTNAKSLLGVMALGIANGVEIKITAEGQDASESIEDLSSYLKSLS